MKSFALELMKRDILFFIVRGFGKSSSRKEALLEAKRPVNIPRGFTYKLDYKPLRVFQESLNHILKGKVTAVAVPGANNKIMWIDIERDLVNEIGSDILDKFDGCYVEKTPRGGLHIALRIDCPKLVYWKGVKGLVDNKTFGYCITYPSKLVIEYSGEREVLHYVKLSKVHLWSTPKLSQYKGALKWLLNEVGGHTTRITPIEGSVRYAIAPKEVREVVSKLSVEQLLLLFQLACDEVGCGGCVQYYVEQLLTKKPIEMKNLTYPTTIPRGLHTVFEVELLGSIKLLGASREQLEEIAGRIQYTVNRREYSVETPPIKNLYYNVERGTYTIALKGLCPLLLANREHGRYAPKMLCTSTLVKKLSPLIRDKEDILLKLIEVVLSVART